MYQEFNIGSCEHKIIKASSTFVHPEDLTKLRRINVSAWYADEIIEMLKAMSFRKFINYFEKQTNIYPRVGLHQLMTWYKDYIGRCGEDGGIAYWNALLKSNPSGRESVYAGFKSAVDATLNGKTKKEMLDSTLCPANYSYVSNSQYCMPKTGTTTNTDTTGTATNTNTTGTTLTPAVVARIQGITDSIISKGSNLSQSAQINFLKSVVLGIENLSKKPEYLQNREVQEIVRVIIENLRNKIAALESDSSMLESQIQQTVNDAYTNSRK